YKESSYKCYITNGYIDEKKRHTKARRTPTDIVSAALTKATNDERIFIYTTGQKDDARWGTKNLEKLFIAIGILPSTICRIDSDTVKDPEHPAFKAGSRINEICDSFAIIIASPTLATGCSIENQKPFDAFFAFLMGVGSSDCARQALMRLRDKSVPRYVFIAEQGAAPNGFGKTQKAVEEYIAKLWFEENRLLNQYETDWNYGYDQVNYDPRTAEYVNELYAVRNSQASEYKKHFKQGLRSEAVDVIEVEMLDSVLPCHYNFNDLLVQTKFIKEAAKVERNEKFSEQPKLDAEDVQKLKKQTELTQNERILLEANLIINKYQTEKLTPALVEKDLTSDYYDQIGLHCACTDEGWEAFQKLKFLWAFSQVDKNAGVVLQHDFIRNRRLLKAELIRESNILSLLDDPAKQIHQYDEQTLHVYQFLANNLDRVTTILGIDFRKRKTKPSPDKFEIGLLKNVLGMMGIYLEENDTKKKINGKTRRTYHVVCETEVITNPSKTEEISVYLGIDRERDKIFTKWLIRDIERAKNWDLKKETFINQRDAAKINSSMSIDELLEFQSQSHYKDLWELVDTDTRIALINRQDNYQLPAPIIKFVDPRADSYQAIIADISTWDTFAIDLETFGNDVANKKGVRKEGLHARKGCIRLIQISNGKTIYIIDLGSRNSDRSAIQLKLQPILGLLDAKLQDPKILKINHNIHFDLRFLSFQLNFGRARNVSDTMKGAQIFFGDYGKLGVLPGGYGLGNLCKKLLGITIDKSEQKSDWGSDELTLKQIKYAALDPFYTYHGYYRIEELYQNPAKICFSKLAQDGIREAWQLENEIIPCAVELEKVGLPINRELALSNIEKCKDIQRELLTQWYELVPDINYTQNTKLIQVLNNKYNLSIASLNKAKLADLKDLPEIKLLGKLRAIKVPIQQLESLVKSSARTNNRIETTFNALTGTGRFSSGNSRTFKDLPNLQSVSAKAHPALKEFDIPSVRSCVAPIGEDKYIIANLKDTQKLLTKYQDLKVAQLDETYHQLALNTLQTICNLGQAVTRITTNQLPLINWVDNKTFLKTYGVKPIRSLIKVAKDKTMIIVDLAGAHGRIAADVADDLLAIAGCNDDSIDNHSKVAEFVAKALGYEYTWQEIQANKEIQPYKGFRDAAKNTYYGWLNGAGAKRIQEQIKANSGEVVSIEACQAAIEGCEALYPAIVAFRKWLVETLSNHQNIISIDGKSFTINKIESVNNRILHKVQSDHDSVEVPYTQCLAAIWSRTEATALKQALVKITAIAEQYPHWGLKAINYVHDEIDVECNTEYVEIVAKTVNNIIGDCFAECLNKVSDGRETNWTKLIVENWSQK
ncbi:MAG: DNA polymerase, partial [Rhizonema sp. NSF051]|nr:DNA polymerase [Rhizonema sp. NSF051]